MIVFIDETGTEKPTADVPLTNRGLLYGDGFFTSMRVRSGVALFWDEHWQRIQDTADYLELSLPLDSEAWQKLIFEKATEADSGLRCRITIFRAGQGRYVPETMLSCALVEITPLEHPTFQWKEAKRVKRADHPLHFSHENRYKLLHKVAQVRAGRLLKSQGYEDGVLLNEHSKVVEFLSSNLCIVKNGCVYTPPIDDGCLDGVVRKKLINAGKAEESSLTVSDLREANEIFACNSIEGIRPVLLDTKRSVDETKKLFDWLIAEAAHS